ncbi:MAG: pilus assembly protein TadG-related protein [Chloroflexi bacterium]|nr:pilus assembly protein TadG-related protein [Chloroflexota bacterium]
MSLFILAILAVVVESSAVYIQRRNLQNAADAAALAGAQELDGTNAGFVAGTLEAAAYAEDNVQDLESFGAVPLEGNRAIRVEVRKKAATAFAGWLSFGEPVVSAKATARIASFNIIRCVVPIGVQASIYFTATSDYPDDPVADPPPLVELKQQNNQSTSNSGLVDLVTGNEADGILGGSACNLTPTIDTKNGASYGVVDQGLPPRLQAAIANDCYTWADVQPPSVTGEAIWRCKPENTVQANGIQASAVVLLPVLAADFVVPGHKGYPLAQLDNGQYLLAYFWISGDDIYDTSRVAAMAIAL